MAINYQVVPPKQKFMDLQKIFATFGSRPLVAYSCKVVNETPMGGYVIAVQTAMNESTAGIKEYMRQLKERHSEKEPIYYICIREDGIIYDNGDGEVKTLPEIMEKKPSKVQKKVESVSDEVIAKALASSLKKTDSKNK